MAIGGGVAAPASRGSAHLAASRRAVLVALAGLALLLTSPVARASEWQGPITLFEAGAGEIGLSAVVEVGASGDAAALWWDDTDGNRIALARRPVGSGWSLPVTVAAPVGSSRLLGVDGSGNVTVVYTYDGATTVVTWQAGAPALTRITLPGPGINVGDLAVGADGDAVLAGTPLFGSGELVVGYRRGPDGMWVLRTYPAPGVPGDGRVHAAINGSGEAIVVFRSNGLYAVTRSAAGDWPVTPETVEDTLTIDTDPVVAIDDSGNAVTAFTYTSAVPSRNVRAAVRPAGGGWRSEPDLSVGSAGVATIDVGISASRAGAALVSWIQGGGQATAAYASLGTTAGAFGPPELIADAGANQPVGVLGDDGSATVAWFQTGGDLVSIQVRARAAGPAGTWAPTQTLMPNTPYVAAPSLSTDGRGNLAVGGGLRGGGRTSIALWIYDVIPPTVQPPIATGTMTAGAPVAFAVAASDAWSAVGPTAWSFGDGDTASASSATHVYAIAGTYVVRAVVTDGGGNAAAAETTVTISRAQPALTSATFRVAWRRGRADGRLRVGGRVPLAGRYTLEARRGAARVIRAPLKLRAGRFTRALKVPPRILPGAYRIVLVPATSRASRQAVRGAKLAAPREGIVDIARLSRTRFGPAVRSLKASPAGYASFHFAALPAGKITLTWYATSKGVRVRLRTTTRMPARWIRDRLRLTGRRGTITAVLTRSGTVVAEVASA